MGTPCDKGPTIEAVQSAQHRLTIEQIEQGSKLDRVLEQQAQFGSDIKQAIEGLTKTIMTDIETRKDVEQLKKDRELLFEMHRVSAAQTARIVERNARCDGAGIFENFPRLWNWYQQHEASNLADDIATADLKNKINTIHAWYLGELGWRRFIPTTLATISTLLAIYVAAVGLTNKATVTAGAPSKQTAQHTTTHSPNTN